MAGLLDKAVSRITVESAWLPPIVIEKPFAPAEPGGLNVGRVLQPKVTIESEFGPIVSKPWGEPVQNWPTLKLALLTVGTISLLYMLKNTLRVVRRPKALSGLGSVERWAVAMTEDDVIVVPVREARARGARILTLREKQDDAIRAANIDYAYLRSANPMGLTAKERGQDKIDAQKALKRKNNRLYRMRRMLRDPEWKEKRRTYKAAYQAKMRREDDDFRAKEAERTKLSKRRRRAAGNPPCPTCGTPMSRSRGDVKTARFFCRNCP